MMITPRLRLATGALALTAFLAGCGDSTQPAGGGATATVADSEQAAQEHNEADTMFAQMMIVHHEGAIEMAQLAQEKAVTSEVQELAGQIEQAQGPEIELMQSWLQQWGEPAASDDDNMAHMGHGDSSGMEMDGLSQEEAMAELEDLSGEAFDARFLELMIEHHRGAVTMAQTALDEGQHPDVQELAEQVVTDQEAEIERMEQLHEGL